VKTLTIFGPTLNEPSKTQGKNQRDFKVLQICKK